MQLLSSTTTDPGSFNNSVAGQQQPSSLFKACFSLLCCSLNRSFQLHDVFNLDNDNRGEDTPTLIDRKDNVFIISNFKSKYPVLQLDLRLISDLVVVIVYLQPVVALPFCLCWTTVISGYLLAGSVIGPGGFNFVSEMVQVETVAQFGVLKFLMEKNSTNALHGQVTIGTLILQDCAVGLLFALLPVLGGTSGILQGTNELYQLASVAFCLLVAWCSDKLGLSLELGSFAAWGVMISTTDLAQHTLEQVGISLAQIGEFAFVLLSRASNLHLVEVRKLYLLLLGTTALSLVTTPFLFKLIPGLVHLGVLLRWFPPDGLLRLGLKEITFAQIVVNSAETVKAISVLPDMFCSSHIWGVGAYNGVDKRIGLFSSLLIQIYSGEPGGLYNLGRAIFLLWHREPRYTSRVNSWNQNSWPWIPILPVDMRRDFRIKFII
ncbi:hypothetical protein GBA52_028659 [Prunus armeniaca]|nr:hypothetical protein GBA52_028659 [Prunus armeniaca]